MPADLTIYVGGQGYSGVIGADGKFSANDLPELGTCIYLPSDINSLVGHKDNDPVDLSSKVTLNYNDPATGTTRCWKLELYGNESQSHTYIKGRKVYVYKVMPSKIDGGTDTVPFRMQFTDKDGNVMVDSSFLATAKDQYRDYTTSFYYGSLNPDLLSVSVDLGDKTISRPVKLGTGKMRVRGNNDEIYASVSNETPKVDKANSGAILAGVAQSNTEYYINDSGVSADSDGVRLMVDSTLDDPLLTKYLDSKETDKGRFSYEFKYLDLVDTHNGNAYVTLGKGQKMNVFWPVPADAAANSEFKIVHFKGLDRDTDMDLNEMLEKYTPEELKGTVVTIDGQKFVKFTVDSFSPFALLYEKQTTQPTPDHNKDQGKTPAADDKGNKGPKGDNRTTNVTKTVAMRRAASKGSLVATGDTTIQAAPFALAGAALVAAGALLEHRRRSKRSDS